MAHKERWQPPPTFYNVRQLAERYGVSVNSIWGWARGRNPGFPQPIKISLNQTRWKIIDIHAWESKKFGKLVDE